MNRQTHKVFAICKYITVYFRSSGKRSMSMSKVVVGNNSCGVTQVEIWNYMKMKQQNSIWLSSHTRVNMNKSLGRFKYRHCSWIQKSHWFTKWPDLMWHALPQNVGQIVNCTSKWMKTFAFRPSCSCWRSEAPPDVFLLERIHFKWCNSEKLLRPPKHLASIPSHILFCRHPQGSQLANGAGGRVLKSWKLKCNI